MYLIYRRQDGTVCDCVYREAYGAVEVATGGDFRKGYITFTKEDFKKWFMSNAIKILKYKPKK